MTHRHMADLIRRTPVTLPGTASVQEACELMHRLRIGAIMVVDAEHHLEGIFTGRDAVRLLATGKNTAHTPLHTVMTRTPDHLPSGHSAMDALRLMQEGGYRHVPMVDHGRVKGIVSIGDFKHFEHARLDEETGIWERM
jgi:CBS domain-containing protein